MLVPVCVAPLHTVDWLNVSGKLRVCSCAGALAPLKVFCDPDTDGVQVASEGPKVFLLPETTKAPLLCE